MKTTQHTPFAVYKRTTLNIADLVNPFVRHSEHETITEAIKVALQLEKEHPSLWAFAGRNDGPQFSPALGEQAQRAVEKGLS